MITVFLSETCKGFATAVRSERISFSSFNFDCKKKPRKLFYKKKIERDFHSFVLRKFGWGHKQFVCPYLIIHLLQHVSSFFILLIGHHNIRSSFFFFARKICFHSCGQQGPKKSSQIVSITGNSTKVSAKWKGKVGGFFEFCVCTNNKCFREEARISIVLGCLLRFIDFIACY